MKQRIVYEVRGEVDTNEGRGGTFLVGFWDHSCCQHCC